MDPVAQALHELAQDARRRQADAEAEGIGREMITLGESAGQPDAVAWGCFHLSIALWQLGRGSEAADAGRRAVELLSKTGDSLAVARAKMNLAAIELDFNINTAEARRLFDEALPVIRATGEPQRIAIALGNLSEIVRLEGDYRRAIEIGAEARAMFEELGDLASVAIMYTNAAHCLSMLRDGAGAIDSLRKAHAALVRQPTHRWIAYFFETAAIIAGRAGDLERAAMMLAFAVLYRYEHEAGRTAQLLPYLSQLKERMETDFSYERYEELRLAGEALTLEEAYAYAVAPERS
jgi:hypothetical protein